VFLLYNPASHPPKAIPSSLKRRSTASMGLLERLLNKLGLRRVERRRFTLDGKLVNYLETLAEDEQRPPQEVAAELIASGAAQRSLANDIYERWMLLSEREQQVTALTCQGYTNREIAALLCIAYDTAKTHVRNVLYKFDVHSKKELRMLLANWDFRDWL
jgi:DNA-binding CsgD family transcriptional regulator